MFLILSSCFMVFGYKMVKIGHNAGSSVLTVEGVGSGSFDPTKMSSWHFDARFPLIAPNAGGICPGNIYNANCVNNGDTDWNCFFGGWDGVSSCHDSVSVSVTENSFRTMNPHVPVVASGTMKHGQCMVLCWQLC